MHWIVTMLKHRVEIRTTTALGFWFEVRNASWGPASWHHLVSNAGKEMSCIGDNIWESEEKASVWRDCSPLWAWEFDEALDLIVIRFVLPRFWWDGLWNSSSALVLRSEPRSVRRNAWEKCNNSPFKKHQKIPVKDFLQRAATFLRNFATILQRAATIFQCIEKLCKKIVKKITIKTTVSFYKELQHFYKELHNFTKSCNIFVKKCNIFTKQRFIFTKCWARLYTKFERQN
jgi:hypothetical protein